MYVCTHAQMHAHAYVQGRSSMTLVRLKPQGRGPDGPPGTTKSYKVGLGPLWAPKFLDKNLQSSKISTKWHIDSPSRSATVHPATNQPTKNK